MQRFEEVDLARNVPQISQLSPITPAKWKKRERGMKSHWHIRYKCSPQEIMTRVHQQDLPFVLIQHQVAKNVFAHSVEGLNDFERLSMREFFCTEKITTRDSVDRVPTTTKKIQTNQLKKIK